MTQEVKKGNLDKADAVQMAFLLLVAGNATMVNMIALVSVGRGSFRMAANKAAGRRDPVSAS